MDTPNRKQELLPATPPCREHQASLLVRCHAPQYRHLYVLSCAGADSLSVLLCAAVAFASRSLEYMRFPDTAHVLGWSRLASSISQEELVFRCFAAITKPHWALLDANYLAQRSFTAFLIF